MDFPFLIQQHDFTSFLPLHSITNDKLLCLGWLTGTTDIPHKCIVNTIYRKYFGDRCMDKKINLNLYNWSVHRCAQLMLWSGIQLNIGCLHVAHLNLHVGLTKTANTSMLFLVVSIFIQLLIWVLIFNPRACEHQSTQIQILQYREIGIYVCLYVWKQSPSSSIPFWNLYFIRASSEFEFYSDQMLKFKWLR